MVAGKAKLAGFLQPEQLQSVVSEGLAAMDLTGRNVLVLIPDGTRTMPMPLLFHILEEELGGLVQTLDYLVATGTHQPMSDAQLSRHLGCNVRQGAAEGRRIFNHQWDDPATFEHFGSIPASEIRLLTGGLASEDVPVTLNRLILNYDHILICGPVFPHEVAGFSGGGKYFFPGIAGPDIIHFTHWLGALVTSYAIIERGRNTSTQCVIDRAVRMVPRPHSLIGLVTTHEGVAGVWCGDTQEAWTAAASLSARRHVVWTEKLYRRVLAIMPEMYDDLWTGAKGAYKMEPAIADGGEVVIYAPHIRQISKVHGNRIDRADRTMSLPGLFSGPMGTFSELPGRHSRPLHPREGAGNL